VDDVNERLVAPWRDRSVAEVRAESRRVFGELVAAVEQLTDEQLAARGRFPWAPQQLLAEGITTEFTEHYREHAEAIRRWLDRRSPADD
jgi:hypothetical protein